MIRILKASLLYFLAVFSVAFIFGILRTIFLMPRLGERWSELIEMPFLFVVIIVSARWIVRRFGLDHKFRASVVIGLIAAAVLLLVEFTVVLGIRGISITEFFAERDPVAGTAYYVMVLIFAAAPAVISYSYSKKTDQ